MASLLEKVYKHSPVFLKTGLLNMRAFLNVRKRYSSSYNNYFEEYKNLWKKDNDVLKEYQKDKLAILLKECLEFVPFYKTRFEALQITTFEIEKDPFKVLNKLPILLKGERKTEIEKLINNNPKRETIEIGFTSGTSGSPTKNYLDKESLERAFALWNRFYETMEVDIKKPSVRFSGRLIVNPETTKPPFWIMNYVENQLFMSSYHLSDANIPFYIKKLNKFRPHFLDGYPSALYIIAKYINQNNISVNFTPKAIATTAETLYDYQKVEIEKGFKCKVYNQYASSEGSPFITECSFGNLHVNLDSGIFEFLNVENKPAFQGEIAKMVVTSFRNYKTPLLRYDIGDNVLLSEKEIVCQCGCRMPIVEKIIGREDDILWTEEKGYVGRMDTAYKGLEGISSSQIIQTSPQNFIINNIVDEMYTTNMQKKFINNLEERLGKNINIQINIVSDIPLGANGKFEAVKRKFSILNNKS